LFPVIFLACRRRLGKRGNIPSGETWYKTRLAQKRDLAAPGARSFARNLALEIRGRREDRVRAADLSSKLGGKKPFQIFHRAYKAVLSVA
jgi:hypothetical protein